MWKLIIFERKELVKATTAYKSNFTINWIKQLLLATHVVTKSWQIKGKIIIFVNKGKQSADNLLKCFSSHQPSHKEPKRILTIDLHGVRSLKLSGDPNERKCFLLYLFPSKAIPKRILRSVSEWICENLRKLSDKCSGTIKDLFL